MFESGKELAQAGGSFGPQALNNMSGNIQRQTNREIERVQARAIIADVREHGRALLANTAMQNTAALTALEQHLMQAVPLGEARYKHIVDSYAMAAAQTVLNW